MEKRQPIFLKIRFRTKSEKKNKKKQLVNQEVGKLTVDMVAAVNHKKIGQPKKIYSQWTGDRRRSNSNIFSSSDTVSSDIDKNAAHRRDSQT